MKVFCVLLLSSFIINPGFSMDFNEVLLKHNDITSVDNWNIPEYESLPDYLTNRMSIDEYDKSVATFKKKYQRTTFDITYRSNGLNIKGVVALPPNFSKEKKYPVVIYNRGGNRNFGRIYFVNKISNWYTSKGYIVFASQYRGAAGSEGKDEFGGADVNDVLKLLDIAKDYSFTDNKNIFMDGGSRGGMMVYLALKEGVKINAAVSLFGPSDMFLLARNRPKMEENVYRECMPDYDNNKETLLKERSALYWAEKINVPLLMLHGEKDWRVSFEHSVLLEDKLKNLKKDVRLKLYPGEGHGLSGVTKDVVKEIHQWFDKYKK